MCALAHIPREGSQRLAPVPTQSMITGITDIRQCGYGTNSEEPDPDLV